MNWIILTGLIFNVVGSVLLAISLSKTVQALNNSIKALEHFKDTFLSEGDVVSFTGLDKHREKANKNAFNKTIWGLCLLIVGFVLQLIPTLIAIINE